MAHVSVGDICITGRFNRLALVIFRREPSEGRPEDVRIVPLAVAAHAPPATERDVLIPASATVLGHALLAESWNARSLLSDMLSIPIGHAESRVVDAVRTAEMVGIAPGVDVAPYADLIGVMRVTALEIAAVAAFEDAEVEAWNAIEAACLEMVPALRADCVYAREAYGPRRQVGVAGKLLRRVETPTGSLAPQPASPPGVHFTAIALDRVVFFDMQPGATRPSSLNFVFSISRSPADPALDVTLALRIEPVNESETTFGLEAAMTAHFERVDGPNVISIDDFAKVNGPALIVPYLRELVTNLTARSRHGTIIFPTVNVHALVAHEMRATVAG